jgi:putative aldouronate transport system substrate-binding protein
MKSMKIVFFVFMILILAVVPVFAGGQNSKSPDSSRTASDTVSGGSGTEGGPVSYPLKTDVTISWWGGLEGSLAGLYTNRGDTPFGKAYTEKTGIKIDWQHPPATTFREAFNLMVADGNFPDILYDNWLNYPGGPEKAIADGVIVPLNDIFAKYCPNLTAFLKSHPDVDRMIKTDSGTYYCFPFYRLDPKVLSTNGVWIRKDWLDELGLMVPETIDEWHTVLKAFKEKKNASAPLSFEYNSIEPKYWLFPYAYRSYNGEYIGDDGKIHYGAIENGYRDWLLTFSQWYKEGLVDPDIVALSRQQVTAKVTGNQTGASMGAPTSRMEGWTTAARATNPQFKLVGAPVPVLKKGDKVTFSAHARMAFEGSGCAISGSCRNIEIAARLLDWNYSKEGSLLFNWGVEGESYKLVNGNPVFTDLILKNPKGLSMTQMFTTYTFTNSSAPFIQDNSGFAQYTMPEQREAIAMWTAYEPLKRVVPPITLMPGEAQEYARIMSEIYSYQNEMFAKFLIGTENLSSWDAFVNTVKKMGIDRAMEIRNTAYLRYNARK